MLQEGGCRWAHQGRDWDLLGDGDQSEEVVLEHLLKIDSLSEINLKAAPDKIFDLAAHLNVFGERERTSSNLFISLLDLL